MLAIFIERALSVIFEHRLFVARLGSRGFKEVIAVIVSVVVCFQLHLDALSILVLTETTSELGYVITGFIVAGGSKGSKKLFHQVFAVYSNSFAEANSLPKNDPSAEKE